MLLLALLLVACRLSRSRAALFARKLNFAFLKTDVRHLAFDQVAGLLVSLELRRQHRTLGGKRTVAFGLGFGLTLFELKRLRGIISSRA